MRKVTMRKFVSSLALVAGLCLGLNSYAQTKGASVEGITEYHLDNGLKVLLFPDNSKPTVTVNITYLVGSRQEGYGETGMAHLLEHMMFKGTTKVENVIPELVKHGANFNGTTSYDRTNYFETMQASDENLRWALEMEADRMVNSRVSRKDLDSEMTVVRNEFERGENSPARVLEERVMSTAYLWHNYGRSTIGALADIEHVPIEKLQAFYREYYQPDDATLVVAGKFDPDTTLKWIQSTLGAIPKPTRKLSPTYTEEPVQDGEREVNLQRAGDSQTLMIAYHTPVGAHPDSAALEVLAGIMGEAPSGRLYKTLVDSKKAVSVSAEVEELHDPGVMMFHAQVRKDGSLSDVEKAMLSGINGIVTEPPSKEEVDRARTRLLKDLDLMLNNSGRVGLLLSEWESMGDWRLLFLFRDEIRAVKPEDVARVAKLYLKPSNSTIGRFIPTDGTPDRSVIPPAPDLAALVGNYKGDAPIEQGEVFDPSPANIDKRTVRVTLPNGMKLALLSKKTRGGTVSAVIALHFGDEKNLQNKKEAAQIAGMLLMRGTEKHDRQQLQDELDRLKAQMNASASADGATVSINTVRATFPDALRLAAEVLRYPAFPETEFEQVRQSLLARLETSRSDPQALAFNAFNRHVSPYPAGDPRAVATIDEEIADYKKASLSDSKKFYADFFGASNAELTVVGDFDADEVRKIAEAEFGAWKSPAHYTRLTDNWQKLESVNRTIETPDKTNAIFAAVTTFKFGVEDPDYPAMVLANKMFGGDTKSRLFQRIRQKEGLSYGVSSALRPSDKDHYAEFIGVASAKPENVLKVESAFKDEVGKAVTQGFSAEEVAEAKKAFFEEQQMGRSQDQGLARMLARNAENGWTMARNADLEKKIAALTPDEINAAVKRQLDPMNLSYFKAGDFKKAGTAQ